MKVAAFLLSVTVFTTLFLESSTTPVDIAAKVIGDIETVVSDVVAPIAGNAAKDIDELANIRELQMAAVQERITSTFAIAYAALDVALKVGEETLAEAKEGEKERVTKVINWVEYLVSLCVLADNTINDALAKDTVEALENAIALLGSAIVEVEADLPKYMETLDKSPNVLVINFKIVVTTNVDIILFYAKGNVQALKSLLPGAKQGSNATA